MRELLWLSLPDQRPRRELYWMSLMPDTSVTAMAAQEPFGDIRWVPTSYGRPVTRFVEAGAFAWAKGLDAQLASHRYDWGVSLELCSLVTGQLSARRRRDSAFKQAVVTWENMPRQPLYGLPPYRQAFAASRGADLVLAMVDAAAVHLDLNGFDMSRVRVVKPGVDTDLLRPATDAELTQARAQRDGRPRVVFISPLSPNKGISTVLAAMERVRQRVPEAQLVVAGSGAMEGLVDEHAARYPGAVERTGYLNAAQVAQLLATADVFTTAPRATWKWTEQLGLAYLEAQACGLPIVTTACGTNDEAVRAPNLLVEDDAAALADGLLHFLTDGGAARAAATANRARMVAEHNIVTQTRKLGAAFAEFE